MDNLTPIWKPVTVYLSAFVTLFVNIIEGIHALLSLAVVAASLIFILYQIADKERQRREYNRRNRNGQ